MTGFQWSYAISDGSFETCKFYYFLISLINVRISEQFTACYQLNYAKSITRSSVQMEICYRKSFGVEVNVYRFTKRLLELVSIAAESLGEAKMVVSCA